MSGETFVDRTTSRRLTTAGSATNGTQCIIRTAPAVATATTAAAAAAATATEIVCPLNRANMVEVVWIVDYDRVLIPFAQLGSEDGVSGALAY